MHGFRHRTFGDLVRLRMVIEIETQLAAAFNIKIANPTPAVRQGDLYIVMTWFELDNAYVSRGRAFGAAINTNRQSTRVGCDQDLSILDSFFRVSRGRSANQGESELNHGSYCELKEG